MTPLTPRQGLFVTQRQALRLWGYKNSHFLRWFEESLAQGIAKNSLSEGMRFPITRGYGISKSWAAVEAGVVMSVFGGAVSAGNYSADKLFED